MNYQKESPKIHDHIYITFQMSQHIVQYQDHPKCTLSTCPGELRASSLPGL